MLTSIVKDDIINFNANGRCLIFYMAEEGQHNVEDSIDFRTRRRGLAIR